MEFFDSEQDLVKYSESFDIPDCSQVAVYVGDKFYRKATRESCSAMTTIAHRQAATQDGHPGHKLATSPATPSDSAIPGTTP